MGHRVSPESFLERRMPRIATRMCGFHNMPWIAKPEARHEETSSTVTPRTGQVVQRLCFGRMPAGVHLLHLLHLLILESACPTHILSNIVQLKVISQH